MGKSIKKNYIYNLVYQILTIIIPIITTPYLARVIGVKGTGVASYTLSIVSYFVLFGSIGVASYGQREIAMKRDNIHDYSKTFWELFIFKTITSIISIIIYTFTIINNTKYNIIFLILTINIFASIFDISWFYQGLEEYKFISVRSILVKILFTISIFLFVKEKRDLKLYIFLNSMSLLISSLSLWLRLPKKVIKIKKKELKIFSHTKNTLIYFLPQIATQIYTMLDKTMLGFITKSESENGYYEQSYKIIIMSMTIVTSLNTVMSPRMSYLYKEKKTKEIQKRLLKSMQFSCLLAIPLSIGIACTSYGFVDWFFGPQYHNVKFLLILFSPIVTIIALSNCLGGQCLTPCGKRLQSAGALWAGAIVNFLLNLLLIPIYKSRGAAIASVIAELIITTLYFVLSKKYISFKAVFKKVYKYIIASLIMGIIIVLCFLLLPISMISTIIELIIGVIIYFAVLFILKDSLVIETFDILLSKMGKVKKWK